MREITDISKLLDEYQAYLMLEKGLSENTRVCYYTDVCKLMSYLGDTATRLHDVTSL